jgi:DNA-binding CsgD family transcriptional regulator
MCLLPAGPARRDVPGDRWTVNEISDAVDVLAEQDFVTRTDEDQWGPSTDLADAVSACVRMSQRQAHASRARDRERVLSAVLSRAGTEARLIRGNADPEFEALVTGAHIVMNAYADVVDTAESLYYDEERNAAALVPSQRNALGLEIDIVSSRRLLAPAEAVYFSGLATAAHCRVSASDDVLLRLALIDNRRAVVPLDPHDHTAGAVVIENEDAVAFVGLQMATQLATARPYEPSVVPTLTRPETSVLRLLAGGHTDESAGRRLGISDRSVRRLVKDLQHKLGVDSRFELAVAAARRGLL